MGSFLAWVSTENYLGKGTLLQILTDDGTSSFSFYVKFPKSQWPDIDKAREFTDEGNRMFQELRDEYAKTYLNPTPITGTRDLENMPNL